MMNSLVPIGVMPQWIWREHRVQDLREAIERYWDAGLQPDDRWVIELHEHLNYLATIRRKPE